jgi:DNA-binding NtrC family response regulator
MANYNILLVDEDVSLRGAVRSYLEMKGFSVSETSSGKACREILEQKRPDAIVLEYMLPDTDGLLLLREIHALDFSIPVLIITRAPTVDLAVRAMKEGADQFMAKPFELSLLLRLLEKALESSRFIRREVAEKRHIVRYKRDPFMGASDSMRRLESATRQVLGTSLPMLIQGETGTGKGVLAEWLAKNGPRSKEAFVDLNCAGLNRELLESDLFGHEKGAFTGATTQKMGLLEVAHQGTLFLDEIGDMDISIQPKLLKALDEKHFRRVGGVRDRTVDVHLIAATHHDMGALVENKTFRSDLYFRISTIPLIIPPLRERISDIPAMTIWFIERLQQDMIRGQLEIDGDAMKALEAYNWPGNIRELRNVLERAALLCKDGVIRTADLHFQIDRTSIPPAPCTHSTDPEMSLEEVEQLHISNVFRKENGKVNRAAAKLKISRSSLYKKLKQYGLIKQ